MEFELNSNIPDALVVSSVIWWDIISDEFERFTEEIFESGNFTYKNPSLSFRINADPRKMLEKVPFVTAPLNIPGTEGIGEIETDRPSEETADTLLNVSPVVDPDPLTPSRNPTDKEFSDIRVWYLIIDPTFIPVNILPGLVKVVPPLIEPPIIPLGNLNLSSKQSALKLVENPDIEVGCFTDLISSDEYEITLFILLGNLNH